MCFSHNYQRKKVYKLTYATLVKKPTQVLKKSKVSLKKRSRYRQLISWYYVTNPLYFDNRTANELGAHPSFADFFKILHSMTIFFHPHGDKVRVSQRRNFLHYIDCINFLVWVKTCSSKKLSPWWSFFLCVTCFRRPCVTSSKSRYQLGSCTLSAINVPLRGPYTQKKLFIRIENKEGNRHELFPFYP